METRSKPGRAREGPGHSLISMRADVPRLFTRSACAGCGGETRRVPGADGRVYCHKCVPHKRSGGGSRVADRLCVRCDRGIRRRGDLLGPFLCSRCKRAVTNADLMRGYQSEGGEGSGNHPDRPDIDGRIVELGRLYATALAYGSEVAARRAGLPTTSEELPWQPVRSQPDDHPTEGGGGADGEDAAGDGG